MVTKYVMLYQMSLLFGFSLPMVLCNSIPPADVAQDDQATRMRDAELEASLFQGDIILASYQLESPRIPGVSESATSDPDNIWPKAKVPYKLSPSFDEDERKKIADAIEEFHKRTCINFIPWTTQSDYVDIKKGNGCYSYVGRIQSNYGRIHHNQTLSLSARCISFGTIIHELMHAVGFWHEQSRTDRDDYVKINKKNITPLKYKRNFVKKFRSVQDLGLPYDFESVMHYTKFAFAIDDKIPTIQTIEPIESGVSDFGQRDGFSELDVRGLNLLYNCREKLDATKPSDDCKDKRSQRICSLWASKGECVNKPKYMDVFCKKTCEKCDIDECQSNNNGGCSQICNNNMGSFTCACRDGYALHNNKQSCTVISA